MWRAQKNGKYFYIECNGTVISCMEKFDTLDNTLYELRNYFQTKELANKALPKWKEFFKNLNIK